MSFFNIEVKEHVGILRFNRPPVNAVSHQVYFDFYAALDELAANEEVRSVLFTGSPGIKPFCGGGDLHEFKELNAETRRNRYDIIDKVLLKYGSFPKPVVGAINGPAIGVGLSLCALMDIRFAADNVHFMIPDIDRGVVSGHLPKFARLNVPIGLAKEWILTGRRFSVIEAYQVGFIDHICQPNDLFNEAWKVASMIASKTKDSVKYYKQFFIEAETMPWLDAYIKSHEYSAQLTSSSNSKEGIRAFFEKRQPNYKED